MTVLSMMRLSRWAKYNKWKTRFIIVGIRVLLAVMALGTGMLLEARNTAPGQWLLGLGIILYLGGVIYYPSKYKGGCESSRTSNYIKRKASGTAVTIATVLMFIHIGSRMPEDARKGPDLFILAEKAQGAVARDSIPAQKSNPLVQKSKNRTGFFSKWKAAKEIIKMEKKHARETGEPLAPGKELGIILVVLLGVVALFFLAALSCTLSCDGNEGGAVLLLIIGIPALIFLVIHSIRSIRKKKPRTAVSKANQS